MPTSIIIQDNQNYYDLAKDVVIFDEIRKIPFYLFTSGPNYFSSVVFLVVNWVLGHLPFEFFCLLWTFTTFLGLIYSINKIVNKNITIYIIPSINFFILIAYGWRQTLAITFYALFRGRSFVFNVIKLMIIGLGIHWSILFFIINEFVETNRLRNSKFVIIIISATFGYMLTEFSSLSRGEDKTPALLALMNLLIVFVTPIITNSKLELKDNTVAMITLWTVLLINGVGTSQMYRLLPMSTILVYKDIEKVNNRFIMLQGIKLLLFTVFYTRRIILG